MKKIKIIAATLVAALSLTACGTRQIIDLTYVYDRAIVSLPNGTIVEGQVQSWMDYEDGDQIQVKINGEQYLIHSEDLVLISN